MSIEAVCYVHLSECRLLNRVILATTIRDVTPCRFNLYRSLGVCLDSCCRRVGNACHQCHRRAADPFRFRENVAPGPQLRQKNFHIALKATLLDELAEVLQNTAAKGC